MSTEMNITRCGILSSTFVGAHHAGKRRQGGISAGPANACLAQIHHGQTFEWCVVFCEIVSYLHEIDMAR